MDYFRVMLEWCKTQLYPVLQDIVSPPYCASCWRFLSKRKPLCCECKKLLRPVVAYDLIISPTRHCTVYSLALYDEPITSLIRAKQTRSVISSYQLGQLMADNIMIAITAEDILVP